MEQVHCANDTQFWREIPEGSKLNRVPNTPLPRVYKVHRKALRKAGIDSLSYASAVHRRSSESGA